MISFEVIKPKPQKPTFVHRMDELREKWKKDKDKENITKQVVEENQHLLAEGEKPVPWLPGGSAISAVGMGKHGYAQWLNNMVYNKYNKGQFVTAKSIPFVPGIPPVTWFIIKDIQEIHYMADMDQRLREPKAIHCVSGRYDVSCWFAPSAIRPCTKEEIEAIDRVHHSSKPPQIIQPNDRPDAGSDPSGNQAATGSRGGGAADTAGEGRTEEGNI